MINLIQSINPYLRYTVYGLISLVVLATLIVKFSPYYPLYNVSVSLPKGFYWMQPCDEALQKGQIVSFDKERPKWIPEGKWIVNNIKVVTGLAGDIVTEAPNKKSIEICSKDGKCSQFQKYSHLPTNKELSGKISDGQFFATGTHVSSLDSRYYGALNLDRIKSCGYKLF